MNKEWSELNKKMQSQMKKATFGDGIETLLFLRETLMNEAISWQRELKKEDFSAMPYINADGYHSKTIAYSLWHVFRIEDIVVNTLIRSKEQVFFEGNYREKMNASIITTGNELVREEIGNFSGKLDIDALYGYITDVKDCTDKWLRSIDYSELKRRFGDADRERIEELKVVDKSEDAHWLIDYWCGKDINGLIRMPLSRHWIMHFEAAIRIKNKLKA